MRVGLGSLYTCDSLCVHSYLGFNVAWQSPTYARWGFGSDSNLNGGALLLGGMNGDLTFLTVPPNKPTVKRDLYTTQLTRNTRMVLNREGRLRVGQHEPLAHPDYRLAVEGKLVAQYIYVTQPNTWADFVFAPDYRLLPLSDLEAYLHLHLPALPSAAEVTASGYSVTDMDARLLQTVEELTLRVIELDKQVKALEARLAQPAAAGR